MCQSLSNCARKFNKNSYTNGQIFERSCVPLVASGRSTLVALLAKKAERPLIGKWLKPKGK